MEVVKKTNEKGQITAVQAVEILRKKGMIISVEDAEKVLELLKKMANIVVEKHLRQDSRSAGRRSVA